MPLYFHLGIRWSQAEFDRRLHIILACGIMALGLLFYSIVAETDEPEKLLRPVRIVESQGWTCITRADGQRLCLSEWAMQEVDEFRDETRYLEKGRD